MELFLGRNAEGKKKDDNKIGILQNNFNNISFLLSNSKGEHSN